MTEPDERVPTDVGTGVVVKRTTSQMTPMGMAVQLSGLQTR